MGRGRRLNAQIHQGWRCGGKGGRRGRAKKWGVRGSNPEKIGPEINSGGRSSRGGLGGGVGTGIEEQE